MNATVETPRRDAKTFTERLAEVVRSSAGATSVFGEAVERDGVTVIPVAKSRWGFGGGAGESKDGGDEIGSGGGGGALARPLGFIEISGGQARYRRIVDSWAVATTLVTALAVAFAFIRRRRTRPERARRFARCAGRRAEPTPNTPARDLDALIPHHAE